MQSVPPVPHAMPVPVTVPPTGAGLTVMEQPGFRPPTSCVHRLVNEAAVPTSQRGWCVLAARRGLNAPLMFGCTMLVTGAATPSGVPSPPISKPMSCSVSDPCVTRKKVWDRRLYAIELASYAPALADRRMAEGGEIAPFPSTKRPKGRQPPPTGSS